MTNVEVSAKMQIHVERNPDFSALLQAYIAASDVFLKERGFVEAVGKFTYFRLNKGNLEVHVEGLGSSGCAALPSDEPIVAEFASRHEHIESIRKAMREDIEHQANALRAQFETDLKRVIGMAQSNLQNFYA